MITENFRQIFSYGCSVLYSNAINFCTALILIYSLSPEHYSAVVLIKASLLFCTSFFGMGLSQAAVRWVNNEGKPELLLNSIIITILLLSFPATLIFFLTLSFFEEIFIFDFDIKMLTIFWILSFALMINNEFINWARANQDSTLFLKKTLFRVSVQILFVIVFLNKDYGQLSYVYGLAVSEIITILTVNSRKVLAIGVNVDRKLIKEILQYGWPHSLIISFGFFLNYVDRFMLSVMQPNINLVAYYDAANMVLFSTLGLLIRPFNLYLFPSYSRKYALEGQKKTISYVKDMQKYFLILLFIVCSLVLLLQENIFILIFPENFNISKLLIPILAVGLIFNGIFISSMAGLYITKRTELIALASFCGILINVVFNYFLIPIYSSEGAAVSTSLGFIASLLIGNYFAKKIIMVKIPFHIIIPGSLFLFFVYSIV